MRAAAESCEGLKPTVPRVSRWTQGGVVLGIVFAMVSPFGLHAQSGTAPTIILDGMRAYLAKGPDSAVRTWTRNWSPADSGQIATLVQSLRAVEAQYGRFEGHEVLRNAPLGSRVQRTYLVMWYERRPLYAFFQTYETGSVWKVIDLTWDPDWTKAFPASPESTEPADPKAPK